MIEGFDLRLPEDPYGEQVEAGLGFVGQRIWNRTLTADVFNISQFISGNSQAMVAAGEADDFDFDTIFNRPLFPVDAKSEGHSQSNSAGARYESVSPVPALHYPEQDPQAYIVGADIFRLFQTSGDLRLNLI